MSMQWYILQVYSGQELTVVKFLKERVAVNKIEDMIGEIIVPTEEIVEMRSGKKRKSDRKFFPGYVLMQADMSDELWHIIRRTPKVLGFVGGRADRPSPISEKELNKILQRVQEGTEKPKFKVLFEAGEVVRVAEGPFADFNGVVEDVNYEKNRVRVAVSIFGRSTPVELEFGQVEKII